MKLWLFFYLLVPVLVGMLINEYKNDIFRLLKMSSDYNVTREVQKSQYDLVIFVPSARNNFEQRTAIRDTWLQHVKKNSSLKTRVLVKFVVGNKTCSVPPEDRLDVYSCDEWQVSVGDNENDKGSENGTDANIAAVDREPLDVEPLTYRVHGVQSLAFRVLHPVVLTKLGVYQDCIGKRVKVRLLERITQREIVSALLTKDSSGTKIGSFNYRTVTSYFLPKGFEGVVVGENLESGDGILPFDSWKTGLAMSKNNGSGVLQFLEEDILPQGHYYDVRRWKSRGVDIVSFIYNLEELVPLRQYIDHKPIRLSAWTTNCSLENQLLEAEAKQFKDILYVDLIDVYRNVPLKFLHFSQWIVENVEFRYLLKTDDDCFVDVDRIMARLEQFGDVKKTWLGRFRHNWVVERHGKWAEPSYPSVVYPTFACGSGYVLSSDLVEWVAKNAASLKAYQGEDVSMAIWLAAVGPNYVDEPLWQCDKDCLSDMYTEPDLRPDELLKTWSNLRSCGDPCGCS